MNQPNDKPDRIVIGLDDLDESIPVGQPGPTPGWTGSAPPTAPPGATRPLPPLTSAPPRASVNFGTGTARSPLTMLSSNSVVTGLVAGLVGGIVGMVIAENLHNPDQQTAITEAAQRVSSGVWVGLVGLGLGFLLMAWDSLTTGAYQRARREGAKGALIGAAAGFVGGYVAQFLFHELLKDVDFFDKGVENKLRLARGLAWAVFGGLAGLGLGINGGQRKMVNGLIGGALGGALGGLAFEQLEIGQMHATGDGMSAFLLRFIGIAITGAGIGLGIGLVERIRRDAWLLITGGPMAGKEFILYNDQTSIGSDFRSDIVLVKDAAVAPHHVRLVRTVGGQVTLESGATTSVNGQVVSRSQRLRSGDTVTIGASELRFQERFPSA